MKNKATKSVKCDELVAKWNFLFFELLHSVILSFQTLLLLHGLKTFASDFSLMTNDNQQMPLFFNLL